MDHGGCALLVGVEENKIVAVKGDPAGFLNKGYICPKASASADKLSHPGRLRYPMIRKGERGLGQWQQIPWDDAIGLISSRLNAIKADTGARGVAFGQGMPKGLEHFALIRLANTFGSPNVIGMQDVCHSPREISGLHTCGFYPIADFHHDSGLLLLWASNPTSTNEEGQICSLLQQKLKKGTDLIVVDPRRTELAAKAKHWLQIRPGTDHALALAFLHVLITENRYDKNFVDAWTHGFNDLAEHVKAFTPEKMAEITWVPAEDIRTCAREYAHAQPAAIAWGNPIEQNIHAFDISRALVCLMAVSGNLDVPGGNIQATYPATMRLGQFVRADLLPSKPSEMIHAHHQTIPQLMTVPSTFFKRAVLEQHPYPVRGLYLQGSNPLLTYADSRRTHTALMKLDFLAVADIFMTPTAALADIVLPAATQFEFNDIGHYGLGHGFIVARPKLVDPPEGCWPDLKILNELGKSMTAAELWHANWEDMLEDVVAPAGLSYSRFVEQGCLKGDDKFKKYEANGFKTATGKVELALSRSDKLNLAALPQFNGLPEPEDTDFPLLLTSCKSRYYLHSSYRWLEKLRTRHPRATILIHPQTAQKNNINQDDEVVIETRNGRIRQFAHLTDAVHPQVVCANYGWWFPEENEVDLFGWNRSNFNMLTTTENLGREFGTPNLKGINCRIGPA
jgi:anaerobic selenocysteine-containing dehydrogenase